MVFQYPEHQLFEETVFDDVAFGPRNQGLDADTVSERVEVGPCQCRIVPGGLCQAFAVPSQRRTDAPRGDRRGHCAAAGIPCSG